jgi:hypothetical protein
MRSPCCLRVCQSPPIKVWMAEPIFMKHGMHITVSEPISMVYFINNSHQSVSVCVSPYSRQATARYKHYCSHKHTRNKRRINSHGGKHITVIARQRLLYYCVRVGKSKCFKPTFHIKKIKIGLCDHLAPCLCVYSPTVARQRFGKNVLAATNTHTTIEELIDTSFSKRSVSYQGRRLVIPRTFFFSLLLVLRRIFSVFSVNSPTISTQELLVCATWLLLFTVISWKTSNAMTIVFGWLWKSVQWALPIRYAVVN